MFGNTVVPYCGTVACETTGGSAVLGTSRLFSTSFNLVRVFVFVLADGLEAG